MTIDHVPPIPPGARATSSDHDHVWRLRDIDYTDGTTVREFGCQDCPAVWFD